MGVFEQANPMAWPSFRAGIVPVLFSDQQLIFFSFLVTKLRGDSKKSLADRHISIAWQLKWMLDDWCRPWKHEFRRFNLLKFQCLIFPLSCCLCSANSIHAAPTFIRKPIGFLIAPSVRTLFQSLWKIRQKFPHKRKINLYSIVVLCVIALATESRRKRRNAEEEVELFGFDG